MKGDPAVIERTLEGYSANWRLHKQAQLHKFTFWEWKKPYTQSARVLGCVVSALSMAVWAFSMDAHDYGPGSPSVTPILVIFAVALFIIPSIYGLIMTIPLVLDKRHYSTTTEHAYYWRLNKDLRTCVPRPVNPHEFSLIIEAAQRADRTDFEHICIYRMRDAINNWKADAKLPTIPEEDVFLEALRTAVRENADRPIA